MDHISLLFSVMFDLVDVSTRPDDLKMPFPDAVKYCILGTSVALLLVALGILLWQTLRCCSRRRQTEPGREPVNTDLLYSASPARTPTTKLKDVSADVHRLSRCLTQTPFLSGSGQTHVDEQTTVTRVDGSMRFSVYYDQLQSRLVVTVLQVEDLQEPSYTCSLQPFVKLLLLWASSEEVEVEEEGEGSPPVLWTVLQEWRTRVVKGSCNPVFGDQFSCFLPQNEYKLHQIKLRMEVRDFDKFSRHTVLGEVRVHLGKLNISYPLEMEQDLQIPQKDLVGELLLSLKFLPTSQRLEVGLLKVRSVSAETSSGKQRLNVNEVKVQSVVTSTDSSLRCLSALHARISVQYNQCKLRHQKTSAVSRCPVTVFNEVLMFSLPEFPLERCKVTVSVYETNAIGKSTANRRLMGQTSVGTERGGEDEHWSRMMRSVRQPVAQWHRITI